MHSPCSPQMVSAFLLLLCCSLFSCSQERERDEDGLLRPANEASQADVVQINSTLEKIEEFVAEMGSARKFRKIPVVVTRSQAFGNLLGGCVSLNGAPQFIFLRPEVLDRERELGEDPVDTTLFRILLHEIGHCYFHRSHDDARILANEMRIELKVKRKNHELVQQYPMLDVSVMASDSLAMPLELRKYYVAELLGLNRARNLEDLATYASLTYVPFQGAK